MPWHGAAEAARARGVDEAEEAPRVDTAAHYSTVKKNKICLCRKMNGTSDHHVELNQLDLQT